MDIRGDGLWSCTEMFSCTRFASDGLMELEVTDISPVLLSIVNHPKSFPDTMEYVSSPLIPESSSFALTKITCVPLGSLSVIIV